MPPEARGRCIENWNGTRRLLITPINDTEVYLALTCLSDDEEARDTRIQPCWSQTFPEWSWLIERIGDEVTWNVYSFIRCKQWSAGRTCILGDAAHAQPPNLGQGGGMALQNGMALVPNDVRPDFIRAAFSNPWIQQSLGKAADSQPVIRADRKN